MIASCGDRRIRVLELATIFAIGGTERQLVNLANGIDAERFDLHLACQHRGGSFLRELARQRPIAEFPISSLYGVHTLKQQARLGRYLRRNQIQVFHAQGFYADVFGVPAARLAGTPVTVSSIRDQGDSRTPLQSLALRAACSLSDALVVNADAVRQQLIGQGYAARKVHVIPNGVDLARFTGCNPRPGIRSELGIAADAPLVAVISRLGAAKGLEFFLEAAAAVARRHPRARFIVVGDVFPNSSPASPSSGYRAVLEKQSERLGLRGRLFFTGFRLDIPEILSQVTVSVLPSLSEALSNSLLEAMAAGLPVVATLVGDTGQAVVHGKSGWTVPPGDAAALTNGVCRLLEAPEQARAIGRAARARIEDRFSLRRMISLTEDLYRDLLARALHRNRSPRVDAHEPENRSASNAP